MDNRIDLMSFLASNRDQQNEREAVFVALDKKMKKHHHDGEIITDFRPRTIQLGWSNHQDARFTKYINYKSLGVMELEKIVMLKQDNIHTFAMMMFCSKLDGFQWDYFPMDKNVVAESFQNFTYLFNERELPYLQAVLVQKQYSYYSDFISNISLSSGNKLGNQQSLTKSTPQGKLYSGDQEAAHIPLSALLTFVAVLTLMLSLAFVYICEKIG